MLLTGNDTKTGQHKPTVTLNAAIFIYLFKSKNQYSAVKAKGPPGGEWPYLSSLPLFPFNGLMLKQGGK